MPCHKDTQATIHCWEERLWSYSCQGQEYRDYARPVRWQKIWKASKPITRWTPSEGKDESKDPWKTIVRHGVLTVDTSEIIRHTCWQWVLPKDWRRAEGHSWQMRRRHTSQGCECHSLHEHYILFRVQHQDDRFHCKVQTSRPPLTMLIFKNTCLIRDDEQEWWSQHKWDTRAWEIVIDPKLSRSRFPTFVCARDMRIKSFSL